MQIQKRPSYPIDVAVVDKNSLIVRGLRMMFAEDGRLNVVATASDGARFMDALERFHFDVAICGWQMPYCSGREVLEKLAKRANAPRIVIYTGDPNPEAPRMAMRLGAAAFYSKSEAPENLIEVVDAVARGSMIFPFIPINGEDRDPLRVLTPRERELLAMLAQGFTNFEIAGKLKVSPNTVKFHLRNLYDKLNIRNRAEAVALHLSSRPQATYV
jgi:two-component system, NarL family, nitrate/nitrite response regulator NarL